MHRARESAQDSQALAEGSRASRDARSSSPGVINTMESQEFLKQKGIWATVCCLFQSLLGQALTMLGAGCFSDWHHTSAQCLQGPGLPVCPAVQGGLRCSAAFAHLSLINVKPSLMNHS